MNRQLEFWGDSPKEPTALETANDICESSDIVNEMDDVRVEIESLFVNPERQHDFGGKQHQDWPAPEVNRNSITIDRIRNDIDGPAHRFEMQRHDFVEVFN